MPNNTTLNQADNTWQVQTSKKKKNKQKKQRKQNQRYSSNEQIINKNKRDGAYHYPNNNKQNRDQPLNNNRNNGRKNRYENSRLNKKQNNKIKDNGVETNIFIPIKNNKNLNIVKSTSLLKIQFQQQQQQQQQQQLVSSIDLKAKGITIIPPKTVSEISDTTATSMTSIVSETNSMTPSTLIQQHSINTLKPEDRDVGITTTTTSTLKPHPSKAKLSITKGHEASSSSSSSTSTSTNVTTSSASSSSAATTTNNKFIPKEQPEDDALSNKNKNHTSPLRHNHKKISQNDSSLSGSNPSEGHTSGLKENENLIPSLSNQKTFSKEENTILEKTLNTTIINPLPQDTTKPKAKESNTHHQTAQRGDLMNDNKSNFEGQKNSLSNPGVAASSAAHPTTITTNTMNENKKLTTTTVLKNSSTATTKNEDTKPTFDEDHNTKGHKKTLSSASSTTSFNSTATSSSTHKCSSNQGDDSESVITVIENSSSDLENNSMTSITKKESNNKKVTNQKQEEYKTTPTKASTSTVNNNNNNKNATTTTKGNTNNNDKKKIIISSPPPKSTTNDKKKVIISSPAPKSTNTTATTTTTTTKSDTEKIKKQLFEFNFRDYTNVQPFVPKHIQLQEQKKQQQTSTPATTKNNKSKPSSPSLSTTTTTTTTSSSSSTSPSSNTTSQKNTKAKPSVLVTSSNLKTTNDKCNKPGQTTSTTTLQTKTTKHVQIQIRGDTDKKSKTSAANENNSSQQQTTQDSVVNKKILDKNSKPIITSQSIQQKLTLELQESKKKKYNELRKNIDEKKLSSEIFQSFPIQSNLKDSNDNNTSTTSTKITTTTTTTANTMTTSKVNTKVKQGLKSSHGIYMEPKNVYSNQGKSSSSATATATMTTLDKSGKYLDYIRKSSANAATSTANSKYSHSSFGIPSYVPIVLEEFKENIINNNGNDSSNETTVKDRIENEYKNVRCYNDPMEQSLNRVQPSKLKKSVSIQNLSALSRKSSNHQLLLGGGNLMTITNTVTTRKSPSRLRHSKSFSWLKSIRSDPTVIEDQTTINTTITNTHTNTLYSNLSINPSYYPIVGLPSSSNHNKANSHGNSNFDSLNEKNGRCSANSSLSPEKRSQGLRSTASLPDIMGKFIKKIYWPFGGSSNTTTSTTHL